MFAFFQKAERNRLKKKKPVGQNFVIFFCLSIGSVGPVDQQINLVSPHVGKRLG